MLCHHASVRAARQLLPLAAICGLLVTLVPATAEEPATQPTFHPQALEVVNRSLEQYRAAKSYQDNVSGSSEIEAKDALGQDVNESNSFAQTLAYARPNRVAVKSDEFAIVSNGKKLWLYTGTFDEYTVAPAPDELDYSAYLQQLYVNEPPHPVLYAISNSDKSFEELFPAVVSLAAPARAESEGEAVIRIAGKFDAAETPFGFRELVPFTLWFNAETGLFTRIEVDLAEAFENTIKSLGAANQQMPGVPKDITRAVASLRLSDVKLNEQVPDERFTYAPEPYTNKVDEFTDPTSAAGTDPTTLVGKPAPGFVGQTLKDKQLSLDQLKGRVIVLDFWATWCGPCVRAFPAINKLHQKYAEKPVTIVGVNQDAPGALSKVKEMVKKHELAFTQFLDAGNKVGRKYKVSAIPCTVVIGKDQKVKAVHVGFTPNLEEELTKEIDKLLKGEELETSDQ